MDLNQVTVAVNDLTAAVDFYRLLGFKQIVGNDHYARFELPVGESTFSTTVVEGWQGADWPLVYLESDDLDGVVARLTQAGISFEAEPENKPWLWREAFVRDPSGNRLCLYHAGTARRFPPWRIAETDKGSELPVDLPPGLTLSLHAPIARRDHERIEQGLLDHAQDLGMPFRKTSVGFVLRDAEGQVKGGLAGWVYTDYHKFFVEDLWVDDALRGASLGGTLLNAAEAEAAKRGARLIYLDTYSFQAPDFYKKMGYTVCGKLDFPDGERARYWFCKELT